MLARLCTGCSVANGCLALSGGGTEALLVESLVIAAAVGDSG
jgi:hypothetical protein